MMYTDNLTFQDILLNDSRITPSGNGTHELNLTQPTSGQKWWASIILGLIFAIISSPPAYSLTSKLTSNTEVTHLNATLIGLLIHTVIFIIIVRIILW